MLQTLYQKHRLLGVISDISRQSMWHVVVSLAFKDPNGPESSQK